MAQNRFLDHPNRNQVRDYSCSGQLRPRYSTAQISLRKILCVITSVPPHETPENPRFEGPCSSGLDLSLTLGPRPMETRLEESGSSGCSAAGKAAESTGLSKASAPDSTPGKSSEGECEPNRGGAEEKSKEDGSGARESQGFLGLLVEAARLVSGESGDKKNEADSGRRSPVAGPETKPTRREAEGGASPVVRSKRRRNQALPLRYRDSMFILEPWKGRALSFRRPVSKSRNPSSRMPNGPRSEQF